MRWKSITCQHIDFVIEIKLDKNQFTITVTEGKHTDNYFADLGHFTGMQEVAIEIAKYITHGKDVPRIANALLHTMYLLETEAGTQS